MSNTKQMSPELIEALNAAGIVVREEKAELSVEQKVEKGKELIALLEMAKAEKNEKLAKKLRSQLRGLGIYLSQLKKVDLGLIS